MKNYLYIAFFLLTLPICLWADTTSWKGYEDLTFYEVEMGYDEGLKNTASITFIQEDVDGIFWMGSRGGKLLRFNGYAVQDVKDFINKTQDSVLTASTVTVLTIDDFQDIWLGASDGLFKISKSDLKCTKIVLDEPLYESNFRNYITTIAAQGDTLYVGTQNGLYLVDRQSGRVLKGFFNDGEKKIYVREGTHTRVGGIYPGNLPHQIWLSLNDRMYQLNTSTGKYQAYIADFVHTDQRRFKQGTIYQDSLLLIPTQGYGMVTFNLNDQSFSKCLIDYSGYTYYLNDILSVLSMNDSITLVTAFDWGTGLLNRYTCTVRWMRVPIFLRFGSHRLFMDGSGYAWSGIGGKLFRTNRAITKVQTKISKPVIDVTGFFANDIKKGMPCFEGYPTYELGEYERSIEIIFSLTQSHVFDSVWYEYQLNGKAWQLVRTPNHLVISNPINGKNTLSIRAIADDKIIAKRDLSFHIFLPLYKSVWFYLCITLTILGIVFGVAWFRINQVRKEERLKADFERKLAETESMALRSQINPHFIFNTLNSIKYYAIKKNPSETGEFINHFSSLIRQILENSKKNLIPLRAEIETLSNYIEVEKLRFRNAFESNIEVDPNIDQDFFMIPPSLLQPFVENAIWHGLMHKEGNKQLKILFTQVDSTIICQIIDNGIGREASAKIHKTKTHKTSLGVSITKERIEHLQTVHGIKSDFEIIDLYDEGSNPVGTKVIVRFSI